jgi:hypothetical protein
LTGIVARADVVVNRQQDQRTTSFATAEVATGKVRGICANEAPELCSSRLRARQPRPCRAACNGVTGTLLRRQVKSTTDFVVDA